MISVELILIIAILVLNIVNTISDYLYKPNFDTEVDQIFTKLKKSDAGVASSTSRLKKKADALLGEAILEQYPLAKMMGGRIPQLGTLMESHPEIVPHVATTSGEILEKLIAILPEQTQDIAKGFLHNLKESPKTGIVKE